MNEDLENHFAFGDWNNPNDAWAAWKHATNQSKDRPRTNRNRHRICCVFFFSFTIVRGLGNENNNNKEENFGAIGYMLISIIFNEKIQF